MIKFNNGFDQLLGGGLFDGVVTQVYGPPASGKTNLALLASVNALGQGKVVYVDPEGGFSFERLKQIARERSNDVLGNVILIQPTTFEEQKAAIAKIEDVVTSMKVALVVVDSIAMLYRMEEDKDVRMLGRLLAQLLRIARKYGIPVLLTNQVYNDFETNLTKPIGGTITEYFTKNTVELTRPEGQSRQAILRRHQSMSENQSLQFRITQEGIETAELQEAAPRNPARSPQKNS
jgi:DNA repair protein RadB